MGVIGAAQGPLRGGVLYETPKLTDRAGIVNRLVRKGFFMVYGRIGKRAKL